MRQGDVLADRYELRMLLGGGGMGQVWSGWDRRLRREVAVKLLHQWVAESPELVARFEREAIAAARIKHPNVVAVYDSGTHADALFLVMERVEGTTLAQLIAAEGALPPARALGIADSVCRALGAAHRAGVVHFDIKPQNIMFDRDGLVKVVDFGIAGFVFNTLTMADASRLAPAGTPDFGAPEQFGPEGGDERADLYALGGVLFAMLTGRAPYTGPNAFAVINIKMLHPAPRVEQFCGDLPAGLGELVAELLDRDPARRPRTTTLVGERLERIERIARDRARQAQLPTQRALPEPQSTWSELPPPSPPATRPMTQPQPQPSRQSPPYPQPYPRPYPQPAPVMQGMPQLPPPMLPAPATRRTWRGMWPSIVITAAVLAAVAGVLFAYSYADKENAASGTPGSGGAGVTAQASTSATATAATTAATVTASTGSSSKGPVTLDSLPDPCDGPTDANLTEFDLGSPEHLDETGSVANTSKTCYWLTLDNGSGYSYALLSVAYLIGVGTLPTGTAVSVAGKDAYESTLTNGCEIYWSTSFGAIMVTGGANKNASLYATPDVCTVTLDWAKAVFSDLPN